MTMQPPMPPPSEYNPVVSGRPARPATVTFAGVLMFLIAALELISIIPTLASYSAYKDAFAAAYKNNSQMADTAGTIATVSIAVGVGLAVLFAIGLGVLAALDLAGKQPARIITWVVAGLVLCCQGSSLAGNGMNASFSGGSGNATVDSDALKRVLEAETPGWVHPTQLVLVGIMVLAAIAVVVLLALPTSHPYFRKPAAAQQFTPPAYPTV
ncbi:hypothetical protein [Hamadaea tsunoensis]|uniref:hypothetical protein n=1 Tax=Hamadaea tsunoensis TaxID=53368 RepID=UPI000425EDAE|nr:hypothetical protein [Hamadaea tsunoensis]